MRAFLSHSSKDKEFVGTVADNLKPGSYELDSLTFDKGALNSAEIIRSLQRSDLFCLFLSKNSIQSPYVDFEVEFGQELIASGKIRRLLTICLDEEAFESVKGFVKYYNMVRKPSTPESAARLIEGTLISSRHARNINAQPFIGREKELKTLEDQANDLNQPHLKSIFVSGNAGAGRHTISQKFYQNQFPQVGKMFPRIDVYSFEGYDELYRNLIIRLRPSISIVELRDLISEFQDAAAEQKAEFIAKEINKLLDDGEALQINDNGGLLKDNGAFQPEFDAIIGRLKDKPHPPITFISPRMIPQRFRRPENDIAYLSVGSLSRKDCERLISGLLKKYDLKANSGQLESLVETADQHPFNIYRMIDVVRERSLDVFLRTLKILSIGNTSKRPNI